MRENTIKSIIFVIILPLLSGCIGGELSGEKLDVLTQEELISLLHAGRVKGIHQPHYGCVSIELKDGETKCFYQEKVDWIIEYIIEHKIVLEYARME